MDSNQSKLLLLDGCMFVTIVMLNNGCCCGMGLNSLYNYVMVKCISKMPISVVNNTCNH